MTSILAPGARISRFDSSEYGALGAIVRSKRESGSLFILSNAHVLAFGGEGPPKRGDAILFPSYYNPEHSGLGGRAPADTVAELVSWFPQQAEPAAGNPYVADAALARLSSTATVGLTPLTGQVQTHLIVGESVHLLHRPERSGKVIDINYTTEWSFNFAGLGRRTLGFSAQVQCEAYSQPGDSGSLVLNSADEIVGLHVAGSGSRSIFTPISPIIDLLDVSLSEGSMLGFQPTFRVFSDAVDVLARTLYGEAKDDYDQHGETAIVAIAAIIANRSRANQPQWGGSAIESICKFPMQFLCWASDYNPFPTILYARKAALDKRLAELKEVSILSDGKDGLVFNVCLKIARQTMRGEIDDPTGGMLDYPRSSPDYMQSGEAWWRATTPPLGNTLEAFSVSATDPRGIRNNNPGNIRRSNISWLGLATQERMTSFQRTEQAFCVFSHPKWGIRAMTKILIAYQTKHGLRTIGEMIARWAPAADNNTPDTYASIVAKHAGLRVNEQIDVTAESTSLPMLEAMILVENGRQPYNNSIIAEGVRLARQDVIDEDV